MKQTIIYVGLDFDDIQYHGSALDKHTGEVIDFKCLPTLKELLSQLVVKVPVLTYLTIQFHLRCG